MAKNKKCRVCGFEYHDCGSCGTPPYMGRGFCCYSCYNKHRGEIIPRILDKYDVGYGALISILSDLWKEDVDLDDILLEDG